jgi:hypothetical protein
VTTNYHIKNLVSFTNTIKISVRFARDLTVMAESSEAANAGSSSTGTEPTAIFESNFLSDELQSNKKHPWIRLRLRRNRLRHVLSAAKATRL